MKSLKYLVPNGFTAISMLFGLASVVMSATGEYNLAAWMILWGVLLDKLDGTAARLLNASSGFGVQFDSFADFVIFGIAPASLFYFRLTEMAAYQAGPNRILLLLAVGFFVVATSARLARFNISEPPGGDRIFYGIPTTLVGATLASAYLTWELYGLNEGLLRPAPFYLLASGVAMITNVRLPKLKGRQNKLIHWFQMLNVAAVYALTPFKLLPEYLLILCCLYMGIGVTWAFFNPPEELIEHREATA